MRVRGSIGYHRDSRRFYRVVYKSRKGHSPLTSASSLDWWFHQGQPHKFIDYSRHGCCLCNRHFFFVWRRASFGVSTLHLIKIRTCNGSSHKCKGTRQGWRMVTWGNVWRWQFQDAAKQKRAALKRAKKLARGSCLVHLWTHEAQTSFSISACQFRCMLHIPPSISEEATLQLLCKQPRITVFLHGLAFTWARAAKSFNLSNKYALPLVRKATLPSGLLVDTFYFIN